MNPNNLSAEVRSFRTEPDYRTENKQEIDARLSDTIGDVAKEIRGNLRRVAKLPAVERRNWIMEKEYSLGNLERNLKLYQHSSSPSIYKSYENVIRDLREDLKQSLESYSNEEGLIVNLHQSSTKKKKENLSLGTPNTTRADGLKKFDFEEVRAHVHSSRHSGIKKSWDSRPIDSRAADYLGNEPSNIIKEKEEKLDREFLSLMERYNKSKQKIEGFVNRTSLNPGKEFFYEPSGDEALHAKNKSHSSREEGARGLPIGLDDMTTTSRPPRYTGPGFDRTNQEALDEYTSLERDINNLKKNILSKIDDAKTSDALAPSNNRLSGGRVNSSLKLIKSDHSRNSSKGRLKLSGMYNNERNDGENEEDTDGLDDSAANVDLSNLGFEKSKKLKLNQSIKKLKSALDLKDNLERSKIERLKEKNKDFKEKVKECMEKIEELEAALQNRERLVRNYENDMKSVHAELDR